MQDALIGHTGFVGSTLAKQHRFGAGYRSTTIGQIAGGHFDTLVCCGAPGQKWLANREPEADRANIARLTGHLETVRCARFVLISTVDVFARPHGVDEDSDVPEAGLHPYGLHRRRLEQFAEAHFERCLIVRLPGLVGPGLRKNVIYDLHNDNNVAAVDSRARFQFYPMVNLWADLRIALDAGLRRLHLAAEPLSVGELAAAGFGRDFDNQLSAEPASYDMRSRHAALFGASGAYQYSVRDTVQAVRCYAQSEPRARQVP